jgi:RNA polymerase sigma-70 factor (ECF subfamily)
MQLLQHREDAADAVQDALQRLVQHRRAFDPQRGKVRAWFLKIVRNRCLDLLRSRSRRRAESLEPAELPTPTETRPDVTAEKREMLDLLKETLMSLPDEQREIILLRDFHQLSYAELAEVLSIAPGTVMSKLHRARQELRRRMPSTTDSGA